MPIYRGGQKCPWCGRLHELHSGHQPPEVGDLSMCWGCGGIGVFGEGEIRKPTPEEKVQIDASPEVRAAYAVWLESDTPQSAGRLMGWNS